MNQTIKDVKKALSDKNVATLYQIENDIDNLFELQKSGFIQIDKHTPPSMNEEESVVIVKGPRFKEL
ncbi:hypothetical protein [Staphylococcus saprophyticus]|uniref:hypothetical protein n=1 Tax=Staphylococcus saprophyticus TaxID=29385 RepID=UPI0008539036|nr:hypothetical protein [Staphylococcus saprophyticus]OEK41280.1 hypothetical protein ASS88_01320 [Staphylococcus saprophyticus]